MKMEVRAIDLLDECIPEPPIISVANALAGGMEKHGPWDTSAGRESILGSLGRHYQSLLDGECYDKKDFQHHASSIALRALQILDIDHSKG